MILNPIWFLGFFLNLFFLYAVFQIYFQSPVVEISEVYTIEGPPKFDRVVFFVADGLRADTFFMNPLNHPYLTSLLHSDEAVWGISDTRVPTESRPGHIALFAGIYEDPSAIFTGWKKNFVEFDSVFNRSKYSIALGSPDVVDMFADGAGRGKVHAESYPPSWQDFLKSNSSLLDTWVLDKFKALILRNELPVHDKLLIFLHMLGIDNTGHAAKPKSAEYLASVELVDRIVPEVENLVKSFYGDDKTIFVFTSDHGMTDWGSHGAGSVEETETPFIIWGTGVAGDKKFQKRLKQADFTALIAGSLGIPFPTNSIGRFPSKFWNDLDFVCASLLANFNQIHQLMIVKKNIAMCGKLPFSPFPSEPIIDSLIKEAAGLAKQKSYEYAIGKLNKGIDLLLEGIVYYERYDQWLMMSLTIYSFLVWMLLIVTVIVSSSNGKSIEIFSKTHLLDFFSSILITFYLLEWPTLRIPYTFVPIYLTRLLIFSFSKKRYVDGLNSFKLKKFCLLAVGTTMGIEILALTFYHQETLVVGLVVNSIWCLSVKHTTTKQKALWITSTIIVAIFPTVPVIGKEKSIMTVSLGSLLCTGISILWLKQYSRDPTMAGPESRHKILIYFQIFMISIASIFINSPEFILTRIFSWLSIPALLIIPVTLSSPILSVQLVSIFLGIATPFVYLSLTYEVFFIPSLYFTLFILLKLELSEASTTWKEFWFQKIGSGNRIRQFDLANSFRLAWLHLFFVYLSFFGIGNIASINSFDPSASRCFVSVFNPFVMMILLLIKIICPFLLVACVFRLLMLTSKEVEQNFLIVLYFCQGMALHMFLNVTNVGSWLEIGTSISHYVIVQVTTFFLFLLYFIANILTGMQSVQFLTSDKK